MNRVTVYERPDGAQIYITWTDDEGRHDMTIEGMTGHAVIERDLAVDIADELARAQAKKRYALAREKLFGYNPERTVGELLRALHMAKEAEWSDQYVTAQKRYRGYWTAHLGEDTRLVSVSPAEVEAIVRADAEEKDWSDRTIQAYLRYIVDAFYYAEKKLKWIGQQHNLSAVDFPSVDSESRAYTEDELAALLPALREVDLRAGGIGELGYATGRRLNAIRTLPARLYRPGDVPRMQFPGTTDKARKSGEAVLTPQAVDVLEALLATPAVHATGLLFPSGELDDDDPDREPIRHEPLYEMLYAAEEKAGIEHVEGRAWHGIKRAVATIANDRRALAKQSGTTEDTLRKVYEQDALGPKVKLAEHLAQRRENSTQGGESDG